jgi:hypothetical protein
MILFSQQGDERDTLKKSYLELVTSVIWCKFSLTYHSKVMDEANDDLALQPLLSVGEGRNWFEVYHGHPGCCGFYTKQCHITT